MQLTRLLQVLAVTAIAAGTAQAAPLSAEQATELLARSQAANTKCNILVQQDAAELERLVTLAERVLVLKQDQAVADRAIARGQKIGSAVGCDATTSQAVRGVLRAAREATSAMQAAEAQKTEPQKPVLRGSVEEQAARVEPSSEATASSDADEEIKRNIDTDISGTEPLPDEGTLIVEAQKPPSAVKKSTKKAPAVAAKKKSKPVVKAIVSTTSSKLQSYAQLAQYYYLQRRCRTMPRSSIASLYNKVVASHRATLRVHAASQVAAVMRQAEARASRASCS